MIGIWTTKFGYVRTVFSPFCACSPLSTCSFHNVWEFWAYNVVFGLFQAPYYAFSQTMMAELTPPGFDNMVRPLPPPSSPPADRACSSSDCSGSPTVHPR